MKISNQTKFSSRLGFIAAASGAAVGLGNIWKFPYEVGVNGGGCFLITYLFFVIILGFPILVAKIAFGRKIGTVYHGYSKEGIWSFLSFLPAFLCLILYSFYTVITGWILGYGIELLKGNLLSQTDFSSFFNNYINTFDTILFYNIIILCIIAIILCFGIQKGIERASKIMMPILLIVLLGLIFYSLTLKNSLEGLKFYLLPNMSLLTKKSIFKALSHAFWSLTIGSSVMITYGTYAKNDVNIIKDTISITISDVLVAFLAGLLLFPLIFSIGMKPNEGPALIFIALPNVFKSLGLYKGILIGVAFFLLLVFAALTSAISMLEVSANYISQKFKLNRKISILVLSIFSLLLSIPSILSFGRCTFFTQLVKFKGKYLSFMDLLNKIIEVGFPIVALLFCLFIRKRWNKYSLNSQINNKNINPIILKYIYFCVCYLAPVLIGVIIFFSI